MHVNQIGEHLTRVLDDGRVRDELGDTRTVVGAIDKHVQKLEHEVAMTPDRNSHRCR